MKNLKCMTALTFTSVSVYAYVCDREAAIVACYEIGNKNNVSCENLPTDILVMNSLARCRHKSAALGVRRYVR